MLDEKMSRSHTIALKAERPRDILEEAIVKEVHDLYVKVECRSHELRRFLNKYKNYIISHLDDELQQFRTYNSKGTESFHPVEVSHLYNFPDGDGTGQKIGIIELGGGYNKSDLDRFMIDLGFDTDYNVIDVSIDGATNSPGVDADYEVVLDVEIILAIVPKAEIRVYFAPNSYQGFYNAIAKAIKDECHAISISWGNPESYWPNSHMEAFNELFKSAQNITISAASGDNGSSDGIGGKNVDFPSSSPYVLACGGTNLLAKDGKIVNEVVWNNDSKTSATGGGVSKYFDVPDYQKGLKLKKRGIPDICGDADPNSGYMIYINGDYVTMGGTSAVSPLWTALVARLNQNRDRPLGFINPFLYSNPNTCNDVTEGKNGAYSASTGWDACSGIGSPNGEVLSKLTSTNPVTTISAYPLTGSCPLKVTFTVNNAKNDLQLSTGDGHRLDIDKVVEYQYNEPGEYVADIVGIDTNVTIKVVETPTFQADPVQGTPPFAVIFTSNVGNGNVITGDGGNEPLRDGTSIHIYDRIGTYTARLDGTDLEIVIESVGIVPSFEYNVDGYDVTFIDTTTLDGPSNYEFRWEFGDGTTSDQENPTKKYFNPGTYDVTFSILVAGEVIGTTTDTVFIATLFSNNNVGKPPLTIVFETIPEDAKIDTDDGTIIQAVDGHATYVYENPGLYFTKLVDYGNELLIICEKVIDFTYSIDGRTVEFVTESDNVMWDFGDGTTSDQSNPTHEYESDGEYTVILTRGQSTCEKVVIISTSSITVDNVSGQVPLTVEFTTNPDDAEIYTGDGGIAIASDGKAIYTYNEPGDFVASLKDYDGSVLISVLEVVSFDYVILDDTVSFESTSILEPGKHYSYIWDFGDGETSVDENPSHTYSVSGDYEVILRLQLDDRDLTTSKTISVTVSSPFDFSSYNNEGYAPLLTIFREEGVEGALSWDFGDGHTSNHRNPFHFYPNPGSYTVTLSSGGRQVIKRDYVIVKSSRSPISFFTANSLFGVAPLKVKFEDKSFLHPETWNWSFGDGETSTEQNPKHVYTKPGLYNVRLVVGNANGSSDFDYNIVVI